MRILYIEDDVDDAKFFREISNSGGHELDVCANIEDGVRSLGQHSYDVLVVDQCLPVINGTDFIKDLLIKPPRTYIFTSANTEMVKRIIDTIGVKITDVLSKAQFVESVRSMIKGDPNGEVPGPV